MRVPSVSARREGKISQEIRDRIVIEHLPLVKAIAIRVHENLPVHVDLDDLIHAGVLGLFDAVAKFDRRKKVEFHSYAKHRIKGAILDSLRELDWASRDMRKRQKQIDAVTGELAFKLGRNPVESEVAAELGVSTDRLRRIQVELRHPDRFRLRSGTTWTANARRSSRLPPNSSPTACASGANWKAGSHGPSEPFRRAIGRSYSSITPTR